MLSSRFPFPLSTDIFQYSNNLRPLDPDVSIQVTKAYAEEIRLKRTLLDRHHERCFREEIHTRDAQWEVLNHILHELAQTYPEYFQLSKDSDNWSFENNLIGEKTEFRYLDDDSIPCAPLDFVGRQVQEDLILLTQYDNKLVLEAGQLCFPGNWSLYFDFGMPFLDIHTPVPGLIEDGLAAKIERFLMRVETGKPWTRLNWSLNAGRRLDTSAETFDEWGPCRYRVNQGNVGELVHLRVEEQNLLRIPRSNSLLFTIHTYLMPLNEIIQNQTWTNRLYNVLYTLSPDLVEYKGLSPYRDVVIEYLANELKVNT